MPNRSSGSRYPYMLAADLLRSVGPVNSGGLVLTRVDASAIIQLVANALSISKKELSEKLANYYLDNEDALTEDSAYTILSQLAMR